MRFVPPTAGNGAAPPMAAEAEDAQERRELEHAVDDLVHGREPAEAAGMAFSPAPEYQVFPTRERPLKPYEAAVRASAANGPAYPSRASAIAAESEASAECRHERLREQCPDVLRTGDHNHTKQT